MTCLLDYKRNRRTRDETFIGVCSSSAVSDTSIRVWETTRFDHLALILDEELWVEGCIKNMNVSDCRYIDCCNCCCCHLGCSLFAYPNFSLFPLCTCYPCNHFDHCRANQTSAGQAGRKKWPTRRTRTSKSWMAAAGIDVRTTHLDTLNGSSSSLGDSSGDTCEDEERFQSGPENYTICLDKLTSHHEIGQEALNGLLLRSVGHFVGL